jgi:hypothetical protein
MKSAKLCALFLIFIAGIAYELYVMRFFSIGGRESFGMNRAVRISRRNYVTNAWFYGKRRARFA